MGIGGINLLMRVVTRFRRWSQAHDSFYPSLILVLFALVIPFLAGLYPIVYFTQEQIDIHVFPDHVVMVGCYVYRNPFPFPVVQGFSLPLPVDSNHPMPVEISLKRSGPREEPVPIRFMMGEYRLQMAFSAREEVALQVRYRQQAPEKSAWYLLTTTKSWRRPLRYGIYRLFPHGVKITWSNYALRSNSASLLGFQRKDFMPPNDWHFSWRVK